MEFNTQFILGLLPVIILGALAILIIVMFPNKLPVGINRTHSTLPNYNYSKYIGNHKYVSNPMGFFHE